MDAPQSIWLRFLPELAEIVMEYLDEIDTCGYLGMVCRHWTMKATERTYRRLCHRVYLQQTQKKSLNVNQWGGLWRNMLVNRPRLRTNGEYWLRTTTWKRPENDRFWEDNSAEYIETLFFRHFRFFDNGRVLYILNNKYPIDTVSMFESKLPIHKKVFEGTYTLHKSEVTVEICTHYRSRIRFIFLIRDVCAEEEGGYPDSYRGKFNVLKLISHSSTVMLPPEAVEDEEQTRCIHKLPDYCNFKFHREPSWV